MIKFLQSPSSEITNPKRLNAGKVKAYTLKALPGGIQMVKTEQAQFKDGPCPVPECLRSAFLLLGISRF